MLVPYKHLAALTCKNLHFTFGCCTHMQTFDCMDAGSLLHSLANFPILASYLSEPCQRHELQFACLCQHQTDISTLNNTNFCPRRYNNPYLNSLFNKVLQNFLLDMSELGPQACHMVAVKMKSCRQRVAGEN